MSKKIHGSGDSDVITALEVIKLSLVTDFKAFITLIYIIISCIFNLIPYQSISGFLVLFDI